MKTNKIYTKLNENRIIQCSVLKIARSNIFYRNIFFTRALQKNVKPLYLFLFFLVPFFINFSKL